MDSIYWLPIVELFLYWHFFWPISQTYQYCWISWYQLISASPIYLSSFSSQSQEWIFQLKLNYEKNVLNLMFVCTTKTMKSGVWQAAVHKKTWHTFHPTCLVLNVWCEHVPVCPLWVQHVPLAWRGRRFDQRQSSRETKAVEGYTIWSDAMKKKAF